MSMTKSWRETYTGALIAQMMSRPHYNSFTRANAETMVANAMILADVDAEMIAKRRGEEDDAAEAARIAWEKQATEKVLRIGRYKTTVGMDGGEKTLVVAKVESMFGGIRVIFEDGSFDDLAHVDAEDGWRPCPIEGAHGPGGDAGGVLLVGKRGPDGTLQANGGDAPNAEV